MRYATKRELLEAYRKLHEDAGESGLADFLWQIESALRGPDWEDENLKWETAARLRWAVLGSKFCVEVGAAVNCQPPDAPGEAELRGQFKKRIEARLYPQEGLEHFISHYARACWALAKVDSISE